MGTGSIVFRLKQPFQGVALADALADAIVCSLFRIKREQGFGIMKHNRLVFFISKARQIETMKTVKTMKKLAQAALSLACLAGCAAGLNAQKNPALAPTPPMGWNSWNWFGKAAIDEPTAREVIDAMVSTGLRDAGYTYVVIDGGWRDTKLGPNGELRAHPDKFPNGMKSLADYAHSKGLKFGLHTVPGRFDCGGDPVGGLGNEKVQLAQFVEWGLDFIKLDRCKLSAGKKGEGEQWTEDGTEKIYRQWSEMLNHCGRDIVLSISAYKFRPWNPDVCNMSRTTTDIRCRSNSGAAEFEKGENQGKRGRNFSSIMDIAEINNKAASSAGNGYWNDSEMMVTGDPALTREEQQAHFALWCVMSSPLMLGNDPRHMTEQERAIILNRRAIAVDQDPSGQGKRIWQDKAGGTEIWMKKLADGRCALLLLNRKKGEATLTADFAKLGLPAELHLYDIYATQDKGTVKNSYTAEFSGRGCAFLLASPESEK